MEFEHGLIFGPLAMDLKCNMSINRYLFLVWNEKIIISFALLYNAQSQLVVNAAVDSCVYNVGHYNNHFYGSMVISYDMASYVAARLTSE